MWRLKSSVMFGLVSYYAECVESDEERSCLGGDYREEDRREKQERERGRVGWGWGGGGGGGRVLYQSQGSDNMLKTYTRYLIG